MSPTLRVFSQKIERFCPSKILNGTEVAIELLDTQVFVGVSSVGLVGDFLDFGAVKFVSSEFCPLASFHCELLGFPIFPPWKDAEKKQRRLCKVDICVWEFWSTSSTSSLNITKVEY